MRYYLDDDNSERLWLSRRNISSCSDFASGEPVPPRPVFWVASSIGVEPLLLRRVGSAPHSRSVRTAVAQRVRTARCNGGTPPLAAALGAAPASMTQRI